MCISHENNIIIQRTKKKFKSNALVSGAIVAYILIEYRRWHRYLQFECHFRDIQSAFDGAIFRIQRPWLEHYGGLHQGHVPLPGCSTQGRTMGG